MKSATAVPWRRNSGLAATSQSALGLASKMMPFTRLAVPTGTVDLSTTTV